MDKANLRVRGKKWSKPADFVLHETDGAHIKYNYLCNAILMITGIQFSQEFDALTGV